MGLTSTSVNKHFEDNATFCAIFYGAQGSGKTLLAASAQKHPALASLAFVDADPGLASIVGDNSSEIQRLDFTVVKDLVGLPLYLKRTLPGVKTVVFDTISALGSIRLNELQGDSEVQDFRYYRTLTGNIERIIANLREAGYSVILTAGVQDETVMVDGNARLIKRRGDATPALWKRISHNVDHIWHTYLSPDGSYNLMVRPSFPPSGGEIVAKTRNERFNQLLKPLERPQRPGIIEIGRVGESTEKYPNLKTFYDLFLQAVGETDNGASSTD